MQPFSTRTSRAEETLELPTTTLKEDELLKFQRGRAAHLGGGGEVRIKEDGHNNNNNRLAAIDPSLL
jgi:hypothetical protein